MAASASSLEFFSTLLRDGLYFSLFDSEVLVLLVFAASYVAWTQLWQKRGARLGGAAAKLKALERNEGEQPPRQRAGGQGRAEPAPEGQHGPGAASGGRRASSCPSAERRMLGHLEQREFTRALNIYRSLERDGSDRAFTEELYSAFIQSAVRVGKLDVVERMLWAMKRSGAPVTLGFWQTTLRMLSSRKHFGACLAAHQVFGDKIPQDKVVYSCLINAALETGAPERAAAMLPQYARASLDAKDHVLFFRVFAPLGDVDSAEATFRRLGGKASSLMLNLLLLTCANAGKPERAALVLRDAHELEKGQEDRIVDVVSYNTAIKGFAQAGSVDECFKCFFALIEHGLQPDGITFSALLDACAENNSVGSTKSLVDAMVASGEEKAQGVCIMLLRTLVKASRLAKALELYDDMKASGITPPDIATYSVLIKALVDQHDLERALRLLEDLQAAGLGPDDIILTHLLEGCRHAGDHAMGKRLFAEMVGGCVKPSEFTLVTMLKLHGRCGAHEEAYDLVAGWKDQHGLSPTVIHYTCLVSGCLRTRSYDQAWKAYRLMRSNGVAPDVTSLSTLLPGMAAAQQWDRVVELAEAALLSTPPLKVPAEILNNAVSQMVAAKDKRGAKEHAERLRGLLRGAGVAIAAPRGAGLPKRRAYS